MKPSIALLVLSSILAAAPAGAVLPAWGANATLEQIQGIIGAMRGQRTRIPQHPFMKPGAAEDVYKDVFASVDNGHLQSLLKDMSGVNPVSVGGETFTIDNRYTPAAKANYRKYWTNYFKSLGIPAREMAYPNSHTENGETEGHNLEAVLPGASPDSIVIIVHYDSMGPSGPDNPAADDDMSGMSILMETARILAARKDKLQHTVRFVAADYEEWASPGLEGARAYTKYIKNLAQQENFKIVAGIDDEQTGWNEGSSDTFDVFSCGGATSSDALGDMLAETVSTYSGMKTTRGCMGENSDQYALWEGGIQAVVFSEHDPFNNPHFDQNGGDTYDKIDQAYFFHIAQAGVTFAARLVGLSK
jgi:hypothetical protein